MIKVFPTTIKESEFIGIAQHQNPINGRSVAALSMDSLAILFNGAYFFFEAESFQEYAESVFVATVINSTTAGNAVILSRKQLLFDCLNDLEQIIDGSKLEMFLGSTLI